jgi:hypothetical protein
MYANMIAAAIRARKPRINDSEPSSSIRRAGGASHGYRKFCSDVGHVVTPTEEFADAAFHLLSESESDGLRDRCDGPRSGDLGDAEEMTKIARPKPLRCATTTHA